MIRPKAAGPPLCVSSFLSPALSIIETATGAFAGSGAALQTDAMVNPCDAQAHNPCREAPKAPRDPPDPRREPLNKCALTSTFVCDAAVGDTCRPIGPNGLRPKVERRVTPFA